MNPTSTNWQHHVRALATTIETPWWQNIENLPFLSATRLFIVGYFYPTCIYPNLADVAPKIFERLSTRQATFFAKRPWQAALVYQDAENIHMAWETKFSSNAVSGPQECFDSILGDLTNISYLMGNCDEMQEHKRTGQFIRNEFPSLHGTIAATLRRIETVASYYETWCQVIPKNQWNMVSSGDESDSKRCLSKTSVLGQEELFSSLYGFQNIEEYALLDLCWTAAIALRLLLCSIEARTPNQVNTINNHRKILMQSVERILSSINYGSLRQNKETTPFFFAASLNMAIGVLKSECEALHRDDATYGLQRCLEMKETAEKHLELVSRMKIAITLDVGIRY